MSSWLSGRRQAQTSTTSVGSVKCSFFQNLLKLGTPRTKKGKHPKCPNGLPSHNLSVHVGSHRMSILSEFDKSPARLSMASVFKRVSFWLIHIRSRKTPVHGRQKIITRLATANPENVDQQDQCQLSSHHPRSIPGRVPRLKSIIMHAPVSKDSNTAAVPL